MSTDKPHLHAEPLSPEVIAIIKELQPWLSNAKFRDVVQGFKDNPRQHSLCQSEDLIQQLDPLFKQLKVDVQTDSNGRKRLDLLRIQKGESAMLGSPVRFQLIPLWITGTPTTPLGEKLAAMKRVYATDLVVLDLEGYFVHVVTG